VNWDPVEQSIEGTGAGITVIDERFLPGNAQLFYRILVR
jgi:hypothetical protein